MSHPTIIRRLLAVGAGAVIGAFGATAIAGAATAQETDLEISVSSEGACAPHGEDDTYEWAIWWFVHNQSDTHEATLETVTLTVSPESAAGEVTLEGLLESAVLDAGSRLDGRITLPETTAVTDLTLEVTAAWGADSQTVTHTASSSFALTAGCTDEVPFLWEWGATCDAVEIYFTNPFDREVSLTFESASGEVVEQTFGPHAWETLRFEYTQGDGVSIAVLQEGEQVTEIRIGAQDVDRPCDGDDDQSDGTGGEESLPVTGTTTALIAGGAVALLGLGAGMFFVARRRRVSFTA